MIQYSHQMKLLATLTLILSIPSLTFGQEDLKKQAAFSLQKAVGFFYTLNTHGGYVYHVTPDQSLRWGEGPKDSATIEVQPPGTPAVGQAFLRAYQVTGDEQALIAAKHAAKALIRGQNKYGGWEHTINFANVSHRRVSFDDDQTQSAISFLMALDREIDDPDLSEAVDRAMAMMIRSQLGNGGWPHMFPEQGNYHDYATFNDGGINDCIRVMMEAHQIYPGDTAIEKSLRKAARFMMISQLPPPQPGWAQQYNEFLQPAWARTFEPPAVCPLVTVRNINTLIDLYLVLHERTLLDPIADALRWLREIRMENGLWGRFIEFGTNKTLYYDRLRIRVETMAELHPERRTGYGYESDLAGPIQAAGQRYHKAVTLGHHGLMAEEHPQLTEQQATQRLQELYGPVKEILDAQEPSGAWITRNDRFKKTMPRGVRWNGQYLTMDRISSAVFNQNVALLCEYLELSDRRAGE